MTGLDLIAEARQRLPDLQAILLTAYTEPEDLIAAINEGRVYRYVTKPWNTADLVITVKNALEAVALRRERDGAARAARAAARRHDGAGRHLGRRRRRCSRTRSCVELVTRALPQIVTFDVAATLVVPPGVGGPGPATMHLHCAEPGRRRRGDCCSRARDRALEIYNQLVGGQGTRASTRTSSWSTSRAQRMRATERPAEAPLGEIRSSLHLPIMAPGAQGGVVGLLYVASLTPGAFTEDDEQQPRGAGRRRPPSCCAACRRASSTSGARWS